MSALYPLRGRHVKIEEFAFDVVAIAEAHRSGNELGPQVRKVESTVLVMKIAGRRRAAHVAITHDLRDLIESCVGEETVDEIVEGVVGRARERGTAKPDVAATARAALQALTKRDIITFRRARLCAV